MAPIWEKIIPSNRLKNVVHTNKLFLIGFLLFPLCSIYCSLCILFSIFFISIINLRLFISIQIFLSFSLSFFSLSLYPFRSLFLVAIGAKGNYFERGGESHAAIRRNSRWRFEKTNFPAVRCALESAAQQNRTMTWHFWHFIFITLILHRTIKWLKQLSVNFILFSLFKDKIQIMIWNVC